MGLPRLLVVAGNIGIAAGLPMLHALQERQGGAFVTSTSDMLFVGFLFAGVAQQSVEAFALLERRMPPDAEFLVMIG